MRKRSLNLFARVIVIAWVLASGFALSGCRSIEDDLANDSSRPWNSPRGWDSRLPSQMMEGR
ncbi:MAG: hypothetical protein J6W73_07310 [Verrucomicrobia bacterium]|nr:hypothetical protein [Verrucomicrobiota bacterium]